MIPRFVRLSLEDRRILLSALSPGPDPSDYDFGPAYEAEKAAWQRLYDRIERGSLPPIGGDT